MAVQEFDLSDTTRPTRPSRVASSHSAGKTKKAGRVAAFRDVEICEFTVVCDTREQLGYEFSGMVNPKNGKEITVPVVRKGLKSGDYSIQGCEDEIAIERKELSDAYNSIIAGRERFEREIERLNALPGFAVVVFEATWENLRNPTAYDPGWMSRAAPASIEGTIRAWMIRYNRVHWWAGGTRRESEKFTFDMLSRFWREREKRA